MCHFISLFFKYILIPWQQGFAVKEAPEFAKKNKSETKKCSVTLFESNLLAIEWRNFDLKKNGCCLDPTLKCRRTLRLLTRGARLIFLLPCEQIGIGPRQRGSFFFHRVRFGSCSVLVAFFYFLVPDDGSENAAHSENDAVETQHVGGMAAVPHLPRHVLRPRPARSRGLRRRQPPAGR